MMKWHLLREFICLGTDFLQLLKYQEIATVTYWTSKISKQEIEICENEECDLKSIY